MSLPEDFNPWEHLQTVFRSAHNDLVRDEFRDIQVDDDISTPRSSLRTACLITDNDNDAMMNLRLWLFYVLVRKAQDFQAPIYGIPTFDHQAKNTFAPQVRLYFSQDAGSVPEGRSPVRAEVSFRIKNETHLTITEGELVLLANRIKAEFATGTEYRWSKGELLVTYRDPENGMNLQIYALSKNEATQLIRKVCDAANVLYDQDFVVTHDSELNFPNTPEVRAILGKTRQLPVKRPTVFVRFRWASCSVWGIPNDICLVASKADRRNPLVTYDP